nr:hypothetical protein [Tanacetum cinerariifolium]
MWNNYKKGSIAENQAPEGAAASSALTKAVMGTYWELREHLIFPLQLRENNNIKGTRGTKSGTLVWKTRKGKEVLMGKNVEAFEDVVKDEPHFITKVDENLCPLTMVTKHFIRRLKATQWESNEEPISIW